jgi:hypothetical protein
MATVNLTNQTQMVVSLAVNYNQKVYPESVLMPLIIYKLFTPINFKDKTSTCTYQATCRKHCTKYIIPKNVTIFPNAILKYKCLLT